MVARCEQFDYFCERFTHGKAVQVYMSGMLEGVDGRTACFSTSSNDCNRAGSPFLGIGAYLLGIRV